jgi:TonB-dependent receptor-like protein
MHFPRRARGLVLAATTVSIGLLCEHAVHGQEAAQQEVPQRPQQSGQVALPPVDVNTGRRVRPPQRKKQVAKRAPPTQAPPKVESATGPVQGYLASRSATGIKTDTPLNEIPQSISVVTADQMKAQGVRNLAQALRYTPGVSSEIAGVENRCYGLQMRGFRDESDTLFYKDGQSLRGTAFLDVQVPRSLRGGADRGVARAFLGPLRPGRAVGHHQLCQQAAARDNEARDRVARRQFQSALGAP